MRASTGRRRRSGGPGAPVPPSPRGTAAAAAAAAMAPSRGWPATWWSRMRRSCLQRRCCTGTTHPLNADELFCSIVNVGREAQVRCSRSARLFCWQGVLIHSACASLEGLGRCCYGDLPRLYLFLFCVLWHARLGCIDLGRSQAAGLLSTITTNLGKYAIEPCIVCMQLLHAGLQSPARHNSVAPIQNAQGP